MVFIHAQAGPANISDPEGKFTVHFFDEKGNLTIRSGETRTWRCNNPGALLASHCLDPKQTIGSLNVKQFDMYWRAIEKNEKWEVGTEHFIEKWYISGVRRKRGVITDFSVRQCGQDRWVCKSEAIALAGKYQLHVTLVHMQNGKYYLRPKHGTKGFVTIV